MAQPESIAPVALARCHSYERAIAQKAVFQALDAAGFPDLHGMSVLVKPNLIMARGLACTNPVVTGLACQWLLEKGAKVRVADSPAFGTAESVAGRIGLDSELKQLGLRVEAFKKTIPVTLPPIKANGKPVRLRTGRLALESDMIFSAARVKAHSQMRITLSVKNCFGCVPGLRKALVHAALGKDRNLFADSLAALWAALPPVAGLLDGIEAMHVTGPSKGETFRLGLVGASVSAPALDSAILEILKINPQSVPLQEALTRMAASGCQRACPNMEFPLENPGDFNINGFIVPQTLKSASFNPARLAQSLAKRIWKTWKSGAIA